MIENLSKLFTVQLSPLLALVSTFMLLFALAGPVMVLPEAISLVSIDTISQPLQGSIRSAGARRDLIDNSALFHDIALTMAGVGGDTECTSFECHQRRVPRSAAYVKVKRAEEKAAGPVVHIGLLGSCFKDEGVPFNCTIAQLEPVYNMTGLPSNTPPFATIPPNHAPYLICIALTLWSFYTFLISFPSFPVIGPKVGPKLAVPIVARGVAWMGLLGFVFGIATTIALKVSFGKDVEAFNVAAENANLLLAATLGGGFDLLWVAHGLMVPSLICALFKVHMDSEKLETEKSETKDED